MPKKLTKPFILILVLLVIIGCYLVFRPFITEIFMAAILATIFYKPYLALTKAFKGRKNLAALLMCLLLVLLIILPAVKLIVYGAEKSVVAYDETVAFFSDHGFEDVINSNIIQKTPLHYINFDNFQNKAFQDTILAAAKDSSAWLISGATNLVKETANFVFSLLLIIMTMFFFFVDGKKMLVHLMHLSPLPDKYDREIFNKFRDVSYSTLVATFAASFAQGIAGAIGFAIVGFPVFLAFILISLFSLLPYLGSAIFYLPVGIYYLLIGEIWQGIVIIIWGFLVIGTIDNIVRAYMIKGKAKINPIFIFFSILGGLALFGLWGVVIGPLMLTLAITIIHIYELEFCDEAPGEGILDDSGEKAVSEKAAKDNKKD